MPLNDLLLPEFDAEMKSTRATLERLPDEMDGYKPHERSMPLLKLANHTAALPGFLSMMLTLPGVDLAKSSDKKLADPTNQAERLQRFDEQVVVAREQLAHTADRAMHENWRLSIGDKVLIDGSRYHAVRTLFFNHLIHHRAQLGVYLRLNDLPVPAIYGPSADE